eukprot:11116750-Alexandrium_andersonii.AAC.1
MGSSGCRLVAGMLRGMLTPGALSSHWPDQDVWSAPRRSVLRGSRSCSGRATNAQGCCVTVGGARCHHMHSSHT